MARYVLHFYVIMFLEPSLLHPIDYKPVTKGSTHSRGGITPNHQYPVMRAIFKSVHYTLLKARV